MHHMYIQEKRDHACQFLSTNYKLTIDDVFLIFNDWEYEWKVPAEQMDHSKEEEEQDRDEEALDEGQGNGKNNGVGNTTRTRP